MNSRSLRGQSSHAAGAAAERIVQRDYEGRGGDILHHRWRGRGGEIDLIARSGDEIVFVEVKKSRSFAQAALRLGQRQMERLCAAAAEFMASQPLGQLTPVRFDVALVDDRGAVQIIENAFGEA